ncbi:nucleotidyl transferase AbiEii/AbiGii toxin family protein [Mycoplasma mycoides subsp. capri]|nr:nucleotidyl transferase AbiEii/AbiGii toxin family protein [Mycoplasma mycoides subsp. capri]
MLGISEKISKNQDKINIIFKGGFLLSNIIGIKERTTKDIDYLLNNIVFLPDRIRELFEDILDYKKGDEIHFQIQKINEIKKKEKYTGFRITVECKLDEIVEIIKIDVATGDIITPCQVRYNIENIFHNNSFYVYGYNLETMLAEKIHAIKELSLFNTRTKDFYDIYLIYNLKKDDINYIMLKNACINTFRQRNSVFNKNDLLELLNKIKSSQSTHNLWAKQKNIYFYNKNIDFKFIIQSIIELIKNIK